MDINKGVIKCSLFEDCWFMLFIRINKRIKQIEHRLNQYTNIKFHFKIIAKVCYF